MTGQLSWVMLPSHHLFTELAFSTVLTWSILCCNLNFGTSFFSPLLSLTCELPSLLYTLQVETSLLLLVWIVTGVTASVLTWASFYMSAVGFTFFSSTVLSFSFVMGLLCLSDGLTDVLATFDALGLISVLLICWYGTALAKTNALITLLYGKSGDILLIFSLLSLSHLVLSGVVSSSVAWSWILIPCLLKSAQGPFTVWLPAAMSAPTPVSALVHSSTLVVAGIVVLSKSSHITEIGSSTVLFWVLVVVVLTSVVASLVASKEADSKKVVAYSTMAQVSHMLLLTSVSMSALSLTHLIAHALYKSGLFLCLGQTMLSSQSAQHFKLLNSMSSVNTVFTMATVTSLTGLMFTSGFTTKAIFVSGILYTLLPVMAVLISLVSVTMTSLYSVRFILHMSYSSPTTHNSLILLPMMVLASSGWIMGQFACNTLVLSSSMTSKSLVGADTVVAFVLVLLLLTGLAMESLWSVTSYTIYLCESLLLAHALVVTSLTASVLTTIEEVFIWWFTHLTTTSSYWFWVAPTAWVLFMFNLW